MLKLVDNYVSTFSPISPRISNRSKRSSPTTLGVLRGRPNTSICMRGDTPLARIPSGEHGWYTAACGKDTDKLLYSIFFLYLSYNL